MAGQEYSYVADNYALPALEVLASWFFGQFRPDPRAFGEGKVLYLVERVNRNSCRKGNIHPGTAPGDSH